MLELTNKQREYLGLDLIQPEWEKVNLKAGPYQPASALYFDGEILKKQIISTENRYYEWPVNLTTKNREFILPKTAKGKEKKLTAAVLEKYNPDGVSFEWTINGTVLIANYNTRINFYTNYLEEYRIKDHTELEEWVIKWVDNSKPGFLKEIENFKTSKRKNIAYKQGDFFAFKLSRNEYGFGRILLDINSIRTKKLIPKEHGLQLIMGPPVLVKIYGYISEFINVDLDHLRTKTSLPSDYMMDNHLFYGEYPIIGNKELSFDEYDFPISFGRSIDFSRKVIFLQWGLIHLEKPLGSFDKYLTKEGGSLGEHNPHGYYANGFYHRYTRKDIKNSEETGVYNFTGEDYKDKVDLRNPANRDRKNEIMKHFGLDPDKSYLENCIKLGIKPMININ